MKAVLGIYDGVHDAGAALVVDGRLVAACSEERFTRLKGQGGWPATSIDQCLAVGGVAPGDVDRVAFGGLVNPNPVLRLWRRRQASFRLDDGDFPGLSGSLRDQWLAWTQFQSPFPRMRSTDPAARLARRVLSRALRAPLGSLGIAAPVSLLDHHRCHAGSAWLTSGFDPALIVVCDGLGDGLCTTVYTAEGGRLTRVHAQPFPDSYGILYATVCGMFGFRPFRHEGKLVGLAAHGDPDAVDVPFPFAGPVGRRRFTWRLTGRPFPEIRRLEQHRREDVCAWLQRGVEEDVGALIRHWLDATGLGRVALAGGVFANVRLNQKIAALDGIEKLFVFPHMGDGGLCVGAALLEAKARPQRLDHVYLGPTSSEAEMERALREAGLPFAKPADLPDAIAAVLAEGGLVGRCTGGLEYGPRALGHRTLYSPGHPESLKDSLNAKLDRFEFMPFAPAVMADSVADWMDVPAAVRHAASFMTVAVDATDRMKEMCPAAVHVDGTARPQLANEDDHPDMAAILRAYEARTGTPVLINTSFNRHEEPIVHAPDHAVAAFLKADLDALALGPFFTTRPAR
jgi:carbamoyltransferase